VELCKSKTRDLKIYFTIILIVSAFIVKAQLKPENKAKIDSLKQLIDTSTIDSIVVKAYIGWDNIIYSTDPKLDLELNQKIESLCNKNLEKNISKNERRFFQNSLSISLGNIGLIYQNQNDFAKSLDYQFRSMELDKEIGNKKGVAFSLFNIGQIYVNLGEYSKAIEFHLQNIKLNEEIGDKKRVANSLNSIGNIYRIENDYIKALDYQTRSLNIRKEIDDKYGMAISLNDIGIIYDNQGFYPKAIENFSNSLKINEELGNKEDIANTLNNIGIIYKNQGNQAKAIDYYSRSLKIREEIDDKKGIATSLNNIGLIYHEQEDYEKALEYYNRCLQLNEKIEDKQGIATSLNNIGLIYHDQKNYDKALDYYSRCLKLKEEIGDKKSIATSLNNIGTFYNDQGNYEKSIEYQTKSLKIREEIGDKKGIATSLNTIGLIYKNQGKFTKAINYGERSLSIAREIGAPNEAAEAANALFKVYKEVNQNKKALEMYELYITLKDSIDSEKNRKEVIRQEYKYQYEKQAVADSIKNEELQKVKDAQLAAQRAENKQQKMKSYFLYVGLFFTLFFGAFIFNRFRITKRQKGIIESQKKQVDMAFNKLDEKNQEILASINYAKRIQSAILPSDKLINEYLPDSFVLYKPKDIVAGDFYWLEYSNGTILFAAADCTGHGVPGAMVSVVCNNGLNRSVREYNLTNPGEILDKTREIVIHEFEKSEGENSYGEVRDGMDIALCSLNGDKLYYAGAYNPLWIIRKGILLEAKADKQPIGKFDKQIPFTTHCFDLEKGDTIYLFSDGYADQFGGPKGKKFKTKAFLDLILSIQNEPMPNQKLLLNEAYENWRGNLEQIDDVCVIGVKI